MTNQNQRSVVLEKWNSAEENQHNIKLSVKRQLKTNNEINLTWAEVLKYFTLSQVQIKTESAVKFVLGKY